IDLIDPQWHCTLTVGNSDIAFAFTADNYKDVLYVAYKKAEQLIQLWTWTIQDYNVQKLISLANKEKHHA
ncbi:MAG: hypothetical protein K0U36_02205, partial [Alphaproteobacteria bacterium]|nr:hypothetical protein [Alphaproteobacteria bacterium]